MAHTTAVSTADLVTFVKKWPFFSINIIKMREIFLQKKISETPIPVNVAGLRDNIIVE